MLSRRKWKTIRSAKGTYSLEHGHCMALQLMPLWVSDEASLLMIKEADKVTSPEGTVCFLNHVEAS